MFMNSIKIQVQDIRTQNLIEKKYIYVYNIIEYKFYKRYWWYGKRRKTRMWQHTIIRY